MNVMTITKSIVAAAVIMGSFASTAYAISEQEVDSLLYMKQEEQLALKVYTELDQQWGTFTSTFGNIKVSEQRHVASVENLIKTYGVVDDGRYVAEFTELYNELMAQASTLQSALLVGVAIEEQDIADLEAYLGASYLKTKAIRNVYSNLCDASYSHLAAFNNALSAL